MVLRSKGFKQIPLPPLLTIETSFCFANSFVFIFLRKACFSKEDKNKKVLKIQDFFCSKWSQWGKLRTLTLKI